jgi:serine/threonine-protein kinase
MEPSHLHAYNVYRDDPVQDSPGQGRLRLDFEGRLLQFERIPDRVLEQDRAPLTWSVLFTAAELDQGDFAPTEPVRAPLVPCDEVMAWKGMVFEGVEGVVQAGMVGGQPTYFEILGPWHLAGDTDSQGQSTPFVLGLIMFGIIVAALVLARRNLKAGRSDTRGAGKLTVIFVLAVFASWFVTEIRLDTLNLGSIFVQVVFGRLLAHGLTHGAIIGVFYVALEPYVRRLWPEALVSWSRLMMGRFRDPLVGRDLLVGMAVMGLLSAFMSWVEGLVGQQAGIPRPLEGSYFSQGLTGIRYAMSDLIRTVESSFGQAVGFLVILLIFRLLFRRNWIAFLALMVLIVAGNLMNPRPDDHPAWMTVAEQITPILFSSAMIVCLLRFGLVSLIGGIMMTSALGSSTLTWDLQAWYAGSSLLAMAAVLGLAGWAFYISMAGRSLFKDSVLDP